MQAGVKEAHAEKRPQRRLARKVVVKPGRCDDGVLQAQFLERHFDLGLGLKVRNAASRGRVGNRREDEERQADGLRRFDEVVTLLVLVDVAFGWPHSHCWRSTKSASGWWHEGSEDRSTYLEKLRSRRSKLVSSSRRPREYLSRPRCLVAGALWLEATRRYGSGPAKPEHSVVRAEHAGQRCLVCRWPQRRG